MSRRTHHPFRSPEARAEYLAFYDQRAARWPVPSETRMAPTSFGETFVRISGPKDAPALVLLPGMSSSGLMWETLIAPLSARHRTYALDSIADVGRSEPTRTPRSAADFAQWLDEVLVGLDLHSVSLIGMSYGAWIAAHMALLRPQRLRRTVWLAPAGVLTRLSIMWIVLALLTAVSRWIHRRFTYWMFADAVKTDEGRRIAEELIADTQVMIRCFAPRPIVAPTTMTDEQLRSIGVPSLVLIGEHETVGSPSKAMRRLSRVAPHIEAELVPGAGHDLPIAQRERVTQRVLEFLAR